MGEESHGWRNNKTAVRMNAKVAAVLLGKILSMLALINHTDSRYSPCSSTNDFLAFLLFNASRWPYTSARTLDFLRIGPLDQPQALAGALLRNSLAFFRFRGSSSPPPALHVPWCHSFHFGPAPGVKSSK